MDNPISTVNDKVGYTGRILNQLMDTLHVLRPYFDDPTVSEIEINAPHVVFICRAGVETQIPVKLDAGAIRAAITLIASFVKKEVGEQGNRFALSGRLPGFRVEAVLPPVAVNGPCMCIRRHADRVFSLEEYVKNGIISEAHALTMRDAVSAKENFLVVGGTGSGKTTLMNTALGLIDPSERLYIIENVPELRIAAPNHVLIECDDEQGMTPRAAVRTAMRMKPKRIILGELRGPEAWDWKDAANTGHPGSAATLHADSAVLGLSRLENLILMAGMGIPYEAVRTEIGACVKWIFFIKCEGDVRRVKEVCRVHGFDRRQGEYEIEHV